MKTLVTISVLFIGLIAGAQAPLLKIWDYRYGGEDEEHFYTFQQTTDGGYILGGWSQSPISGDKTQDCWGGNCSGIFGAGDSWVIKVDSLGIKQWDKRFGGIAWDRLYALQQTADGGYILGSRSSSGISGDKTEDTRGNTDYWIVKIDAAGTKQWDKRYGGGSSDDISSLQQTIDGGYILGGISSSDSSGDKTQPSWGGQDYWIVKTDSLGIKQWDRRFGGMDHDRLNSLLQTFDRGYILAGSSRSKVSGDKTQPNRDSTLITYDYWVVKIDSAGNLQWEKTFGGTDTDVPHSIIQTADRGYLLGGYSLSGISGDKTQPSRGQSDYWIVKIDSAGNLQWDKAFGGSAREDPYFGNISQTLNGGYLIAGISNSDSSGDKSENRLGLLQTWIVQTDSTGNKQWDKTIFTTGSEDRGLAFQTMDGCYAIASSTISGIGGYKSQPMRGPGHDKGDFWLIKFCDTTQIQQCNLASPNISANHTIFCAADSAQICAPSGFITYQWNNGQTARCITAKVAGNYYLTVTDAAGCTAESNRIAINVYPQPPVSISVNKDTLRVYNAVTQQWFLNGSPITGATNSIYVATQGGSYTVQVTDSNGCIATSTPVIITGIENFTADDLLSVSPNPSTGNWQLQVGNNLLGGTAEVFDASGKLVFTSVIGHRSSVIFPDVPKGVYVLRVSSSKGSAVRKLVRM